MYNTVYIYVYVYMNVGQHGTFGLRPGSRQHIVESFPSAFVGNHASSIPPPFDKPHCCLRFLFHARVEHAKYESLCRVVIRPYFICLKIKGITNYVKKGLTITSIFIIITITITITIAMIVAMTNLM